jgi:hypothetical protein
MSLITEDGDTSELEGGLTYTSRNISASATDLNLSDNSAQFYENAQNRKVNVVLLDEAQGQAIGGKDMMLNANLDFTSGNPSSIKPTFANKEIELSDLNITGDSFALSASFDIEIEIVGAYGEYSTDGGVSFTSWTGSVSLSTDSVIIKNYKIEILSIVGSGATLGKIEGIIAPRVTISELNDCEISNMPSTTHLSISDSNNVDLDLAGMAKLESLTFASADIANPIEYIPSGVTSWIGDTNSTFRTEENRDSFLLACAESAEFNNVEITIVWDRITDGNVEYIARIEAQGGTVTDA